MPNLMRAPHLGLPDDLFPIAPNWPILSRLPESSLRDAWGPFHVLSNRNGVPK